MSTGYLLSTSAINVFIHLPLFALNARHVEAKYGCLASIPKEGIDTALAHGAEEKAFIA